MDLLSSITITSTFGDKTNLYLAQITPILLSFTISFIVRGSYFCFWWGYDYKYCMPCHQLSCRWPHLPCLQNQAMVKSSSMICYRIHRNFYCRFYKPGLNMPKCRRINLDWTDTQFWKDILFYVIRLRGETPSKIIV